jgi:hypothetical protein
MISTEGRSDPIVHPSPPAASARGIFLEVVAFVYCVVRARIGRRALNVADRLQFSIPSTNLRLARGSFPVPRVQNCDEERRCSLRRQHISKSWSKPAAANF